jgi:hypothetical protein
MFSVVHAYKYAQGTPFYRREHVQASYTPVSRDRAETAEAPRLEDDVHARVRVSRIALNCVYTEKALSSYPY